MKEWKFEGLPPIFVRDPNLQPSKATLEDLKNSGVTRNTPRVSVGKDAEPPKTVSPKDSIMIEQSTNYAFALSNSGLALSFSAIRNVSTQFYGWLPEKLRTSLYDDISRGVRALDSEPCLNTYMFALGKMHNAKLRKAYDHLSSEFLQQETVDIVDYGCGQAMGCICYADFLREKGIRQKVRRVVLIEPSEFALKRAALHVSLMFPDAELRTVCKGFDDLSPEDLCSDTDTPTLHILSNVLDIGDQFYDLNKFADLVAATNRGYNEFVCVEPLFSIADIDSRPARFFNRLRIEPYYQFSAGKGEFVQGQTWTCALLLGTADKREKSQGIAVVRLNDKWELIDRTGKKLFSLEYEEINDFHEGLAGIRLNGKWGFIDKTGQIVIPPKYDEIFYDDYLFIFGGFFEGFIKIKLNGKLGLIDSTGKEVVSPRYDEILNFHEGLARVKLNGKWGFIDKTGEIVILPKYEKIENFHEDVSGIKLNGKWGFIDKTGNEVVPPRYDKIEDFSEGLAKVVLHKKWGFIDKTGKEVVSLKYDWALDFGIGLACVELNGKWGIIDKIGKEVIPPKYDDALQLKGLISVKLHNKWCLIDSTCKEVMPPKYDEVCVLCEEGLAKVVLHNKRGFIDKTGKEVVPLKYDQVWFFSEGLATIKLNGKWGFIDKTGNEVVPPKYDEVWDLHEGLAEIQLNGKRGFVDKIGKEVIPPKYDKFGRWRSHEGLIGFKLNDKWGIINLKGEIVVPAQYDAIHLIRQ